MDSHPVAVERPAVWRRRALTAEATNVTLRERIEELEHQLQEARQ